MPSMLYIVAILFVMASPLAVPATVTIVHAISNWRQATAARVAAQPAARRATAPAHPATTPTLTHTVPATA